MGSSSPVLAIHGGCGAIPRADITPDQDAAAREGLRAALSAGWSVLNHGGSALDAVTAAVSALEDHPSFNAGHGAVLNQAGDHELDASVMEGTEGRNGAVAAARHVRHPVAAARLLADACDPALLVGPAADDWARHQGLEMVDNTFFTTTARRLHLRTMLARQAAGTTAQATQLERHGTVGAVARDAGGHLAAATSTGGFTAKTPGRVGDSAVIGAGTWADDRTCAVSGTGDGELFIRTALAHTIHARMLYLGESLAAAAQHAVDAVGVLNGAGGLCAVDRDGLVALPYNTEGMYRGWINAAGSMVAIHDE